MKIESTVFSHFPLHCFEAKSIERTIFQQLAIYLSCSGNRWGVYFNFGSERLQSVENACNCFILRCNLIRCSHASYRIRNLKFEIFRRMVLISSNGELFEAKEVKSFWHSVFCKIGSESSFHILGMSFSDGK